MLAPITKRVTDESVGDTYCFTFYCDLCGSAHGSNPYMSNLSDDTDLQKREAEHDETFAWVNQEMKTRFNRCPVCERIVCDTCFRPGDKADLCKECADTS